MRIGALAIGVTLGNLLKMDAWAVEAEFLCSFYLGQVLMTCYRGQTQRVEASFQSSQWRSQGSTALEGHCFFCGDPWSATRSRMPCTAVRCCFVRVGKLDRIRGDNNQLSLVVVLDLIRLNLLVVY
jgi:hypothetical protein